MHLSFEQRKNGKNRLPVRVVKKRDPPQHRDDGPFISPGHQSRPHAEPRASLAATAGGGSTPACRNAFNTTASLRRPIPKNPSLPPPETRSRTAPETT